MDNPGTESSGELDTNQAAQAFSSILGGEPVNEELTREDDPAAEAPAETTEEAEAAAEEAKPVEDDTVEVEVDGYKFRLPKDKAQKLEAERLFQADYTRKTMAAAEERKAAQQAQQQAQQERQAVASQLNKVQAQLEGALQEQQKVDWDALLQSDPQEYLKQRHLYDKRQAALQQTYAAQQALRAKEEAEARDAYVRHLQHQQQELLAKVPEWKDSAKAEADKKALREYLLKQGYDEGAVESVSDAKAVVLARKAMLYDQMMSKAQVAAKKVSTLPTKVERPGGGDSPALDKRSAAFQRLSKSGRAEDAAAVFASLL